MSSGSELSSHSISADASSASLCTYWLSVRMKRNSNQDANLFQSAQLFHISLFVQGFSDEIPALVFIGADDGIGACAAATIAFPDDEHVREI